MAVGRTVDLTGLPARFGGGSSPSSEELLGASLPWPDHGIAEGSLSTVRGIGPAYERLAAEAGVTSPFDLFWRIPTSYGEPPARSGVGELGDGDRATVVVEVGTCRLLRRGRRTVVEARVEDPTGTARAVWFNRPWVADRILTGQTLLLEGRRSGDSFVVAAHREPDETEEPGLRPRYSSSGGAGASKWARWTAEALPLAARLEEPLPAATRRRLGLPGLASSIAEIHRPASLERAALARRRLAFEELFLHQLLVLGRAEAERRRSGEARPLPGDREAELAWLESLPFDPTPGQEFAMAEIGADLSVTEPMRRLLMGEVGAGKTVVAAFAMLKAVLAGGQAALMAPTEVLAEQHHRTISGLLAGTGTRVDLFTGSTPKAARDELAGRYRSGVPGVVIGTHALLGEGLPLPGLALAVIDEEHRFGVGQRMGLDRHGGPDHAVHRLHLSATPIPRTLALTVWGDLELSELRELPAGRSPVETEVLGEESRERAFGKLRDEVEAGRQGFVVCPLVEESDVVATRAAETEAERLASAEMAGRSVGLVHGRMAAERKEEVMGAFSRGELDVLVATTVIEVGIDVPNASVMVVEGAESFGMAQLHQLRGRVGRGAFPGHCFLVSGRESARSRERLEAIAAEPDGFRVAELDLAIRGEGELSGTRQHGLPRFRVASLPDDRELLLEARREVERLRKEEGGLTGPVLAPAVRQARARFGPSGAV